MTTEQDAVLGGRYRLVSAIAVGGMGQVWRGLDQLLGRVVAVKVLKPELASDPGFLDRFRTEARHSAGLSHPSIATVYDYGEEDGSAYLVMELVPGEPLSDLLAREGALPAARAASLVAAAAHGLAAAHRAGLVHRDVKPGNLMVVPGGPGGASGGIKITDFGIARAAAEAPVTATGEVMGTAAYFAPEQAIGRRDITPAADLYALGVVLYEALAGRRPFTGDSQVAIALAQVNEPAPPLPAGVPHAAAALTAALLTKDPDQRPDDAAAVAEVAEALAVGDEALALDRLRAATPGGAVGGWDGATAAGGWGTTVLPPDGTTVLDPHRTTGRRAAPRAGVGTAGLGAAGAGAAGTGAAGAGTGTGGAGAPWDPAPTSQPLRGQGVDERDPWSGGGRHTAGAGARGTGAQEAAGGGGRGSRLTVPALGLIAVALLLVVVAFITGVLGEDAPPATPTTAPPPATSSAPTTPSATEPSTTSSSEAPTSEPEETEPTAPPETVPPETSEPAPSETGEPSATSSSSTSSTGAPTSSSGSGTASGSSSSGSPSTSSASAGASGPTGATGPGTPSSTAAGSLPGTDAESGTGPVVALPDASVGPRSGTAATVDSGRSDSEDGTG